MCTKPISLLWHARVWQNSQGKTKTGVTEFRRDLLGYLKQYPITQEGTSVHKVISRVPQLLATLLVVLASWPNTEH